MLIDKSRADLALLYVLLTVVVGAIATFLGIIVAARINAQKQTGEGTTR